jgi:uncharacterized protein with FMN-binding domain
MRRAVPVLLATLGALALIAGFHTSPAHTATVAAIAPTSTEPAATDQRTAPTGGTPPPTTAPPTTRTTAANARRAFDGSAVYTQFGDVQVRAVLQGHRLVDVQALQLPFDHQRSKYISDRAGPWLRDEALQAQSARIQTISGATYTSIAYKSSLQSALDRAARS